MGHAFWRRGLSIGYWCVLAVVCLTQQSNGQQVVVSGQVEVTKGPSHSKSKEPSKIVVWLRPLDVPGFVKPPGPPPAASLVQKSKSFDPHLLIIQVGTVVDFPNHDPFFHNVFSLYDGKRFDLGLYEAGTSRHVRFDKPGVCYIFCNIHPEMSAVVLVLDTPFYGAVNGAGTFTIADVPPGRYQMRVWDERALPEVLDKLTREGVVSEAKQNVGMIKVAESDISIAHKNKYGRDYDTTTSSPVYIQP